MNALVFHFKDSVVTGLAVVFDPWFLQMLLVAEDYLARIFCVIGNITQVYCTCCYRHSQAGQDYG